MYLQAEEFGNYKFKKTNNMHLPTINQINGRLLNQPAIKEYLFNSTTKQQWNFDNYKNRSFNFVFLNHYNEPRQYNLSINGNFVFAAAMKELATVIKTTTDYCNTHKKEEYLNIGEIYFTINTKIDVNGVIMSITTNFKPFDEPNENNSRIYKTFKVKSNKTFADFNQIEYLEKLLNRFLFPAGMFRKIQLMYNLNKTEVAAKYREILKIWRKPTKESIDTNLVLIRRIKRKLNISVDPYDIINDWKLINLLKTTKRYKRTAKAVKAPNMFQLLEDATSQFDNEDEIMEYANEYLNEYQNTILI